MAEHLLDAVRNDVLAYAPDAEFSLVEIAFHLSITDEHSTPDVSRHALGVARTLAGLRMDIDTISAALLCGPDGCACSPNEVETRLGPVVATIVREVTQISGLDAPRGLEELGERLRSLILALGRDPRVFMLMCAGHLQRLRGSADYAREASDVYIPLTARLGLERLKRELEDLVFRYVQPLEQRALEETLRAGAPERGAEIERAVSALRDALRQRGIVGEVTGTTKEAFRVWKAAGAFGRSANDLPDLLVFRVIVGEQAGCYAALGAVHAAFFPVAGGFTDYVALPKANGYQSLHTTVVDQDGRVMSVQIRSARMDWEAEAGLASHWQRDFGHLALSGTQLVERAGLHQILGLALDVHDPIDFAAALNADITASIRAFTPNRAPLLLSTGACALDFAYLVDPVAGDHCVGAKVNGKAVPLNAPIKTGDTVEIITHPDSHPVAEWLGWARSEGALERIRRGLAVESADQGAGIGRQVIDAALHRYNTTLSALGPDEGVAARLSDAKIADIDDLATQVIGGRRTLQEALSLLVGGPRQRPATTLRGLFAQVWRQEAGAVVVDGIPLPLLGYATCCRPLHGEAVVGYLTQGRGLNIHTTDCPVARGLDVQRMVPARWGAAPRLDRREHLRLHVEDRLGMLAGISAVCKAANVRIWEVSSGRVEKGRALVDLGVVVRDRPELNALAGKLRAMKGVESVVRVAGLENLRGEAVPPQPRQKGTP